MFYLEDGLIKEALEVLEEEDICFSDFLVFSATVMQFKEEINSDAFKAIENLECLLKLPRKKKEQLKKKNNEAITWVVKKIAKNFYKKDKDVELKLVEILRGKLVLQFFSSIIGENFYIDCEESLGNYIRYNHNYRILLLCTVIQTIIENPELSNESMFKYSTDDLDLNLLFMKQIDENEKKEIMVKSIRDLLLKLAPILYMENVKNVKGEEKLSQVFSIPKVNKAQSEYIEMLEEENSNILEERKQERREYSKILEEFRAELAQKEAKIKDLKDELKKYKKGANSSLLGLKVVVIGDTQHKTGYKKIIESYNGEFIFLDGFEDHNLAREKAASADLVFHITAHSAHSVHFQIKDLDNIIFVNNPGLESFKQKVKAQFTEHCKNCGSSVV